jgi:hypothetical protein
MILPLAGLTDKRLALEFAGAAFRLFLQPAGEATPRSAGIPAHGRERRKTCYIEGTAVCKLRR